MLEWERANCANALSENTNPAREHRQPLSFFLFLSLFLGIVFPNSRLSGQQSVARDGDDPRHPLAYPSAISSSEFADYGSISLFPPALPPHPLLGVRQCSESDEND